MSIYTCLDDLQSWLTKYLNFEKTPQKNIFWLDTMEFLCNSFSHPESAAPCFHVAGSKGKGSVSAFISSILHAAHYKVGLYTSPHIVDFVERIGSAHGPFTEAVYKAAAAELIQTVDRFSETDLPAGRRLTWFELVTLYAFLCFRTAQVDYSVYEVGLGGRLDSTNVIQPIACCITPIELEHTEFLGNTLEAIASEKGGIIKPGVPVFVAQQKPAVKEVFERIAREKNAPIFFIDDSTVSIKADYNISQITEKNAKITSNCLQNNTTVYKGCSMTVEITAKQFARPLKTHLKLLGDFQAQNAALAAIAVKSMLPTLDEAIIEQGLSEAVLPGRFEVHTAVPSHKNIPALVFDGAHTVNSVAYTLQTFKKLQGAASAHLLFACAADKDMTDIALLFKKYVSEADAKPAFSRITLTKPGLTKQSDLHTLCNAFDNAGLSYTCQEDYKSAICNALEEADKSGALLLVTGSFYLLSEVKQIINL